VSFRNKKARYGSGQKGKQTVTSKKRQQAQAERCRIEKSITPYSVARALRPFLMTTRWVEDRWVECPLHQGRFELATGKPLCEPVTDAVRC